MADRPTCTVPAIDPFGEIVVVRAPIEPRTWKRPQPGRQRHTDPDDQAYRNLLRTEFDAELRRRRIFDRPLATEPTQVCVEVACAWPYPKRYDGGLPVRGDVDNYGKAVADALEGVAWGNDRQIAALTVSRCYTDGDAFVEVTVAEAHPTKVDRDPEIETYTEEIEA